MIVRCVSLHRLKDLVGEQGCIHDKRVYLDTRNIVWEKLCLALSLTRRYHRVF